jgi:hypothetical protein
MSITEWKTVVALVRADGDTVCPDRRANDVGDARWWPRCTTSAPCPQQPHDVMAASRPSNSYAAPNRSGVASVARAPCAGRRPLIVSSESAAYGQRKVTIEQNTPAGLRGTRTSMRPARSAPRCPMAVTRRNAALPADPADAWQAAVAGRRTSIQRAPMACAAARAFNERGYHTLARRHRGGARRHETNGVLLRRMSTERSSAFGPVSNRSSYRSPRHPVTAVASARAGSCGLCARDRRIRLAWSVSSTGPRAPDPQVGAEVRITRASGGCCAAASWTVDRAL